MDCLTDGALARPSRRPLAPACTAILVAALGACASAPPSPPVPLVPPPATLEHFRQRGNDFVQVDPDAPVDFEAARGLRIDLLYVDRVAEGLEALPPRVEAIADLRAAQPFVVEARWLRGAVLMTGEEALSLFRRWQDRPEHEAVSLGTVVDCLPPRAAVQAVLSLEEVYRRREDFLGEYAAFGPLRRTLEFHVLRAEAGEAPRVALATEDLEISALPRLRASEVGAVLPVRRDQRSVEVALLEPAVFDSGVLLIALPSIFLHGDPGLVAALIQETEPQVTAELREAWSQATPPVQVFPEPRDERSRRLARTLHAIQEESQRRAGLGLLALELEAGMAEDLVGYATPLDLERLAAVLPDGTADAIPPSEALRWTLERAAYTIAVERMLEFEPKLEFESCLLRRAGELGRDTGGLTEILRVATDVEDLRRRFVIENRRALESADPAIRVRAHDWLVARNAAIPGYEPLALREDRRRALSAAAAKAAAPVDAGEGRP